MKCISIYFALLMMFFVMMSSMISASASYIGSHEVYQGDTVTYEIHAIACPTQVKAVDFSIYYDNSSLEYVENSLTMPALENPIYNTDLLGEIRVNAITLSGFDFSQDSVLASVKFRVTDDIMSDISLYCNMKNFVDSDKTELKDSYIYDLITVNAQDSTVPETVTEHIFSGEESTVVSSVSSVSSVASAISDSDKKMGSKQPSQKIENSEKSETEKSSSITEHQDGSAIPSDKAIVFETLDTPKSSFSETYKSYIIMGIAALIMILLATVFVTIFQKTDNE